MSIERNTCSICLESLLSKDGDTIGTAVPCGHCFHTKCFRQWKAARRIRCKCPNCNTKVENFIKLYISTEEQRTEELTDLPPPILPPQQCESMEAPTSSTASEPSSGDTTATRNPRNKITNLKITQQNLSKIICDRQTAVGSMSSLREDRQVKRICKLKASLSKVSSTLGEHQANVASIQIDSLRQKEKKAVEDLRVELQTLCNIHREHGEIINSMYSEKFLEHQSRAEKLKRDYRTLNETLVDYGAVLKSIRRCRKKKAVRKLERSQQELCRKVHGLAEPIQSLHIETLQREQSKKIVALELDVHLLCKRVEEQGEAIQGLFA